MSIYKKVQFLASRLKAAVDDDLRELADDKDVIPAGKPEAKKIIELMESNGLSTQGEEDAEELLKRFLTEDVCPH